MKRLILGVALLCAGCGGNASTGPTAPPTTPATTPFLLELNAAPGIGVNGGRATITARVLNRQFNPLEAVDVTFIAASGTLSVDHAVTNTDGLASTTLVASAGPIDVKARAGSIEMNTLVALQPVAPPPITPPITPEPLPTAPFAISLSQAGGVIGTAIGITILGNYQYPLSVSWTFGDGTTATTGGPSVTHMYTAPGTYSVVAAVVAANGHGTATGQAIVLATAPPSPLYVTVHCTPATPGANTSCSAEVVQDGVNVTDAVTYIWYYGDGGPVFGPSTALHAYTFPGKYRVDVTAQTSDGHRGTGSIEIAIPPL